MVRENLAYDFNRFEERKPTQKSAELKIVRSNENTRKSMTRSVVATLVLFGAVVLLMCAFLFSAAQSLELSNRIKSAEKLNKELLSQQTLLEVEKEQMFSLKVVSELAEEYGMVKAEKYQMRYLSIAKEDTVADK